MDLFDIIEVVKSEDNNDFLLAVNILQNEQGLEPKDIFEILCNIVRDTKWKVTWDGNLFERIERDKEFGNLGAWKMHQITTTAKLTSKKKTP